MNTEYNRVSEHTRDIVKLEAGHWDDRVSFEVPIRCGAARSVEPVASCAGKYGKLAFSNSPASRADGIVRLRRRRWESCVAC